MKIVAIALISLLLASPVTAFDYTISDFAACGWLLVDLNDPQLEDFARMSLRHGITTEQLHAQIPAQVQFIKALGEHEYALRAQESCKVLGFTVNLNEELTT
ncbi:hypothetical protein LCGC14_2905270 [marine sediment metagenome]|uniref:Uncharacterized protein n=1 Tax=marine sediment metagenome TaxID=412755 RepID=A0A0F8YF29_9ZZZZ